MIFSGPGKSPSFSAMIVAALTQRRIMGGDFNAALSRYGYAQSTSALFDKVDKFFQDFVHSTHGTLIESEKA